MKTNSLNVNDSQGSDLRKRFLKAAMKLHLAGRQMGLDILPCYDLKLPLFTGLTPESKMSAVLKIESSAAIFEELMERKEDLRNSATVIWSALKYLGFVPPSDFFDKIGSDDIVQVYSADGVHLFANLKFFELCSYTLEQIHSNSWDKLWYREPHYMEEMMGILMSVMQPEYRETYQYKGGSHPIIEIASPFRLEFDYQLKFMAPLFDRNDGSKRGFVVVESGKLLNELPKPDEQEELLEKFYAEVDLQVF